MSKRQYAYFIFVTPVGKGYGCFSIDEEKISLPEEFTTESDNYKYTVSASYCHPHDRKKFVKKQSRMMADSYKDKSRQGKQENLKKVNQLPFVEFFRNERLKNYHDTLWLVVEEKLFCPSWAFKSMINGLYFETLYFDNLSYSDLFIELCKNEESDLMNINSLLTNYASPSTSDTKESKGKIYW